MSLLDDEAANRPVVARLAPAVFTLTIFLSASLLFFVQPLFTRIVLPQIGGSPSVWTTAMLFFQCILIAGYLYAHLMARYLPVPAQMAVHLVLWALALAFLPLAVPQGWSYDAENSVALQTLGLYLAGVGLPFLVLSANAPLIQAWYGQSGGPSADDPYFLYGASNLGSLIALLAFPLAAEPLFGITAIGEGFAAGFLALGAALLACGLAARSALAPAPPRPESIGMAGARPTLSRMALWAFLAFLPSSTMLGVTLKISTDLGAIPLIWAVPLALYLLTFVLSFGKRRLLTSARIRPAFRLAVALLVVLAAGLAGVDLNWGIVVALLAAFFVVALMAHRRLYELRPGKSDLTLFYLVMSVGGALGGVFNSLLAPVVFDQIHELRIAAGLAALLLLRASAAPKPFDIGLGVLGGLAVFLPEIAQIATDQRLGADARLLSYVAALFAVLWLLRSRGAAPVAAVAALLAMDAYLTRSTALFADRSFFGTHRVEDADGFRKYVNGSTLHGVETVAEIGAARPTPLSYYYPAGPMGQVFTSDIGQSARTVGIVGLGAGALACYRAPHQAWHFYEIDRKVDEIARDSGLFSYVSACAPDAPTHFGDARIVLERQGGPGFDILVIDAYSSDAVPVHLTTTEAVALYRDRLAPGGLLVLHISNRYYALDRPLGRSAAALGLAARIQSYDGTPQTRARGDAPSLVVIMAEDAATLAPFDAGGRWQPLQNDGGRLWTDEYANLLSVLH
ncbi:MAG: fused MFS/spermidine synthase [Paracoccaceae bacterium]|nr:fused MFS/spermidine synthase [Paracoccaceae bacterium]